MSGEIIAFLVILLLIALFGVIFVQILFIKTIFENFDAKEKDLLNRVMSRNYETYVQAEVVQKDKEPLSPEEIYEKELERGIPI
jgi:predicted Holliday junction resolvase-like endonuclease